MSRKKRAVKPLVSRDRLAYKQHHLGPTLFQQQLLEYVKERKEIPFNETVGFNWTMLGGLLSRHVVTWDRRKDGAWLVLTMR